MSLRFSAISFLGILAGMTVIIFATVPAQPARCASCPPSPCLTASSCWSGCSCLKIGTESAGKCVSIDQWSGSAVTESPLVAIGPPSYGSSIKMGRGSTLQR